MKVYGAITVLKNKEELDWDGTSLDIVLKQLEENGLDEKSEYGKDWKYTGDLDPSDCDIYLSINTEGVSQTFVGCYSLKELLVVTRKLRS